MAPFLEEVPSAGSEAKATKLAWERINQRGYEILERPYGTHVPKRVIAIGAGATGICFAQFSKTIPNLDVQIYEKSDEVSGTWHDNRYPGCACDIPAHIYQFQWAPNPHWSHYYVGAKEIFQYFKDVVDKHDLTKLIKLKHQVIGANWNPSTAKWIVEVQTPDGAQFTDTCDFLINGCGLLNNWKWPQIKGLHSFKGQLVHSANYDESIQLKGKKVAVFGAGSSGVQIVATIQPLVDHLYTWIRSPLWISSGFASKFAGSNGTNFAYPDELKARFATEKDAHLRYMKMLDEELGKRFNFMMDNTDEARDAVRFARQQMENQLRSRPELIKKIIPTKYGVGCRRPTPGNGYLEALLCSNVSTYTDEVRMITRDGFIDHEGNEHQVDVIICATGFDVSYVPRFPITANGKDLRKVWESDPVAYFGTMVPDFPNYFASLGPYNAANGSLIPPIEQGCHYILQIIEKCQIERVRSISPTAQATQEFREHSDLLLKRTVWNQPCRSWFKNGTVDGLPRIYPGSRAHFMEVMKPRFEDFELQYESDNRFYYLGNGFASREFDGRDPTWYLGLINGQDKQPDYSVDEKLVIELCQLDR
ncbi:uncharacterized protein A1O9_12846 [Exophiala aquamarina CBS 119918]|uniref:Cyclohexanone monooxygenase n=1 Tax=Exophiala aquamarina CBS 119918 TaxID=1182545 RepID=A0A072NVR2_9EURO|nr:uncharacterized protein A1O9_12846 [Exophiala aquamarina CBS 119918]KEF51123.1 hypothetical protein A1O9_12846 [Exophiala aquamarina CBS 119918]